MNKSAELKRHFDFSFKAMAMSETVSYGGPVVDNPSKFIPDIEMNTKAEMKCWRRDLEKERLGEKDFERSWGLGTSYKHDIPGIYEFAFMEDGY